MKLVAYARDFAELERLKQAGASEVLLAHSRLSRMGSLTSSALNALAGEARKLDIRPVLEWDILMTNTSFDRAMEVLNELDWNLLSAVRVQDPGAYEYVLKKRAPIPIQLILETGNHNLEAIRRWCQYGEGRVERVVLSIELPQARIEQYIRELPVPVEVLGLGPILLLYTPRHLLSNQRGDYEWMAKKDEAAQHLIQAIASSDETLHNGFRVIENQHGTQLFHAKDYCLLDQARELIEMNLGAFRVDYRQEQDSDRLAALSEILRTPAQASAERFIEGHPRKVTRCFFKANATDVLFKKLKNTEIQRRDQDYLGDVVEIARDCHTVIHVQGKSQSLQIGQKLNFITPEGQTIECQVQSLTDLDQRPVDKIGVGDFGIIQYVKRATPGSSVYLGS